MLANVLRSRRTRRSGGFSVLELIVVIGIGALLASYATLAQSSLLPHYRLSAATRQVVTDLRLLRAKAIAQNNSFRMVLAANSNAYHAERFNAATSAWEQYALYGRGAMTGGTAQPVELPTSIVTTSAVEVTFEPRGTVTTGGSPPITLSAPGPRSRTLAINLAGLITIS